MAKDYYDILGVAKDASDDEIKKAYRKMAHKYHPDKKGGDEAKFKEVNEAYQTLSNKQKRAQYDQFGQTFDQTGSTAGGFDFSQFHGASSQGFGFDFGDEGMGDIFSEMFGGHNRRSRRGRDIQIDVTISFQEMIKGVIKEVTIYKSVICERCDGSGGEPGTKQKTCSTCGGTGHIQKTMQTFFGTVAQTTICDACGGTGKMFEKKCSTCNGKGSYKKEVEETIDIPAGINDGQSIAITGKGDVGVDGALPGDLIITVHVTPDTRFKRKGYDIHTTEHISFVQAALGDKIMVETVDGAVKMKIPAGTQSGEVFKIRGKGIPKLRGIGRGDHFVKVIVDVPKSLTRKQKKIIEQLHDI